MLNSQNSRRSFLASLAVLSAGTVISASPLRLFSSQEDTNDLQLMWSSFLKNAGAREYCSSTALSAGIMSVETKGHVNRLGKAVYFEEENLLAQPTWIFWQNNQFKPADVLIHVYENKHPYKKIITLNRFQLNALMQVSKKTGEKHLLTSLFTKRTSGDKIGATLKTQTTIKKRSHIQHISYYKNDQLLLKEKLIHNA